MGISGILGSTLDVLWFSYFAKIEQKWHLPKLPYSPPRKNTDSLSEESGDFEDSGKLTSNTAPQGAHILLGVLSENIRGWGGIPRSEKEKK